MDAPTTSDVVNKEEDNNSTNKLIIEHVKIPKFEMDDFKCEGFILPNFLETQCLG